VERHEMQPFKKNQFLRDIEDEEREIMAREVFCVFDSRRFLCLILRYYGTMIL